MLKECLTVYQELREQNGISVVLDRYQLADGIYIIVGQDGNIIDELTIKAGKRTERCDDSSIDQLLISRFDYCSKYLNSNKAVDPKKIIQSNNYLTFFAKKESLANGKLTNEIIDGYFDRLADPYMKYKTPKAKGIYEEVEKKLGPPKQEQIEKNREWIKEHIFSFHYEGKDYLKIFFMAEEWLYEQESTRYFVPNLYNSNQYNLLVRDTIYGLPDNNLGMNDKKPYLESKSRRVSLPYLLSQNDALLQKEFFDLLLNFNMQGRNHIFIDTDKRQIYGLENGELPPYMFTGIYLKTIRGKTESEIHYQDIISQYSDQMDVFQFENILGYERFSDARLYREYKEYTRKQEMQSLIDEILFSKILIHNYFTRPEDIAIQDSSLKTALLLARERIFNWVYKGQQAGIGKVLDTAAQKLVTSSMEQGCWQKAVRQFNLKLSLQAYFSPGTRAVKLFTENYKQLSKKANADVVMEIVSNREYCLAVGQMVRFFIWLSSRTGKGCGELLVRQFMNTRHDSGIKQKLRLLYDRNYQHQVAVNSRQFRNLYTMIHTYAYKGSILKDDLAAGMLMKSILFEKSRRTEK